MEFPSSTVKLEFQINMRITSYEQIKNVSLSQVMLRISVMAYWLVCQLLGVELKKDKRELLQEILFISVAIVLTS